MKKILIVDDHSDIRRLLSITLSKEFEIFEASDGMSAMQFILRHQPDIALLDVMMPGEVDGLQLLEYIKTNPTTRHIKVAMVTARGQQADGEEARRLGAEAYFIKPFSPLQVVTWVREQLQ